MELTKEKMEENAVKSIVSTRAKMSKLVTELYERISRLEMEQLKLSLEDPEPILAGEPPEDGVCSPEQLEFEDLGQIVRRIADLEEELIGRRNSPEDHWSQALGLTDELYMPHTMREVDLELEF